MPRFAWLMALSPLVLALEAPWLLLWAFGARDWRVLLVLPLGIAVAALQTRALGIRSKTRPVKLPATLELVSASLLVLGRRHRISLVVLVGAWAVAVSLCLVMGERSTELPSTRLEFIGTTLALATLISSASLRWLTHVELSRLRWLIEPGSVPVARTLYAEVLTAVVPTLAALAAALLALGWQLPSLSRELPWATLSSLGVAVLTVLLVPLFARGGKPARAPLRAVVVIAPYLFVAPLTRAPLSHVAALMALSFMVVAYQSLTHAGLTPRRTKP